MSAFSQLPNSRWTVVVGVPRSEFSVAASQPAMVGTALALVLLSFGVLAAVLEATKIERPIRQLALAARAWREGGGFKAEVRGAPLEIAELIGAFDGALDLLKSREDALAEAQARLSLALRAASAGTWEWDLRTGVASWSPEFFELVRIAPRPPGADLTDLWNSLIHPDDRAEVAERAKALDSSPEPFTADIRVLLGPEKELRWLRTHAAPIAGPDGRVTRVVGVNLDVTVLRGHEAALERANVVLSQEVDARTRELDQIWRLSRDPFLVADSTGRWLRVSPAWTEILGWTEEELVGRTSEWMEHPQDRRKTRKQDERLARGEVVTGFENRFRARDGSYRWFAWMAVPFEGFNYCVARDVTAERDAAAELQRAQEALRQSQKMDAIGQLTGGVAHDFNNLLTPIVGSLDMLKRRATLDERDARLLEGAAQSAERARVLVQRLLAFARRQPLQPRPLDVAELVASMSELIGSTLGPRIRIGLDVQPDLPKVRGDQNQLEMALLNLAVNARDAMPDGGSLTLSAREVDVVEAAPDLAPDRYVCLSVTDTGAGMDDQTLARAIEPFFSTKGVGKGTGLGLSMAHGLVAQLGGALRISSHVGVGTTVEIWLPEAKPEAAAAAAELEAVSPPDGEGVLLLVDDDAEVRLTTAAMLADLGYSVVEASGGREALSLLDGGLRPDVVVTDHLMPGVTGAELIQAMRNRGLAMPVLIVSGYADVERLPPDLPRLAKPFLQRELGLKLRAITGAGTAPVRHSDES
jgi:PAS domain S-box-containing protein